MDLFQRSGRWKNLQGDEFNHFRNILLSIADDIVGCCERNDLSYCLAYGSALGAVRHCGFIPWDDDVDFFMPRKDYLKFIEIAAKELNNKYYIRCVSKGDPLATPTCHVRLKGTHYVNYGDLVLTAKDPEEMRGIYIDIAPLDDSSNNPFLRKLRGEMCLFYLFAASCVSTRDMKRLLDEYEVYVTKEELKALRPKLALGRLLGFRSAENWVKRYDKLTSAIHNNNSEFITCYTGYKKISKSVYKRKDIFPCRKHEFEGRMWNIPHDYDAFLKQMYGDYMTPPRDGKQKIHPVFELDFGEY